MKYTICILFCILSVMVEGQNLSLQELVNRKQFPEVLARVDSLTAGGLGRFTTL